MNARRTLTAKRMVAVAAVVLVAMLLLAACGSSTNTTTAGSTSTPTAGGTIKVGMQAPAILDPQFASLPGENLLNHQIYDWLVTIDNNYHAVPDLATKWDSPDGKVWTFEIRQGVKFSNGDAFTADDVVYSLNRLRDPKIGAPTDSLYANVQSVQATDASHVQVTLKTPNPEFPLDLGDYHSAMLDRNVKDPKKVQIGTGPFVLSSYSAEDRAVLNRNPNYWGKDANGQQLPYLDSVQFVFSPDMSGQVAALQGGQLDFVPGLSAELATEARRV
jgi:peptide/nickel transport system substrate-binding protein